MKTIGNSMVFVGMIGLVVTSFLYSSVIGITILVLMFGGTILVTRAERRSSESSTPPSSL